MTTFKFTVFTPAYNRAHTLARVYDSLKSQTFRDFEWIVIDDGSADHTADLVREWQHEADFPIIYQYQVNSGKHIAFNRGVEIARGELFLSIDADDGLLPESLESMLKWWEDISESERAGFTGIVTLCRYEDGTICGRPFPRSPLDTNALDLKFKYKKLGDCAGFHRTEILKAYPFPEDKNVRYIPENLIWDDIARKYKVRCINEMLYTIYRDAGNQISKGNPRNKALHKNYYRQILNRDFDYFFQDPVTFAKWATLYIRYSMHLRDWGCMNLSRFNSAGAFLLCCLAVPPGIAFYLRDNIKFGSIK